MSSAKGENLSNNRFGLKKILLILIPTIFILAAGSYITYETVTADVTVIQDGEEISTQTMADDVKGLMDELGIDVSKHDDLSVELDKELTDGMVIQYTKANQVKVTIDDQTEKYYTTKDTVKQFLKEQSINLGKHDEVSVALDENISDGLHVNIDRAVQVTVNVGDQKQTAMVTDQTVGELLKNLNIQIDDNDRISAKLDQPAKDNQKINIVRVAKETVTEEVEIPFDTVTQADSDLLRGKSKVVKQGQNGKKVQTFEVIKENGQEVSRKLVDEKVVAQSVNRVIVEGTKVPVQQVSAEGGEWMTFNSTKYTADCTGCSGYTATGVNVNNTIYYNGMRVIAVDPDVIPLWSKVEVRTPNKTFTAIALDTGGAINGRKIDILVETKAEARQWGYRSVQVRIIE